MPPIPVEDREHILRHTADVWRELAGARIFVTGGTGFYGKWLLETIAAANDELGANVRATILSRNPAGFSLEVPHLASRPEFFWLKGDTADFDFPAGNFDHVLHFATASAAEVGSGGTAAIMHTLRGTERVLQFARSSGVERLLFASSGAVYGPQPTDLGQIAETFPGAPDLADRASGYGEMKRLGELMCASTDGIDWVIARGFCFVGPYLPLTDKFAVGSFIRDALSGRPIRIHGDGSPVRSYLYAADLAIWLPTLLVRGRTSAAYNVGSDQTISIRDVARAVSEAAGSIDIEIAQKPAKVLSQYVPSIDKARQELGLKVRTPFAAAIARTIQWAQHR